MEQLLGANRGQHGQTARLRLGTRLYGALPIRSSPWCWTVAILLSNANFSDRSARYVAENPHVYDHAYVSDQRGHSRLKLESRTRTDYRYI